MTSLSRNAEARVRAAPLPPQRYGLGIVLRKPYPSAQDILRAGSAVFRRGEALERHVTWDALPGRLLRHLEERVAVDTLTAAHVLRSERVALLRLDGVQTLALRPLSSPGTVETLLLDVAPGAQITITEGSTEHLADTATVPDGVRLPEGGVRSSLVLLTVGEGATVRWTRIVHGLPGPSFLEHSIVLEREAVLELATVLVGSDMLREQTQVVLGGPHASARVSTLFVGAANHQCDLGMTAIHDAPQTTSDLRARGVLTGRSQAVVRGLIRVEEHAPQSDGYQRCDTILLSRTAEVDPIPILEILTDDVRCTHGVTTGHLHPDHLFYLRSRGLSEAQARDVLVEGFLAGALTAFPESTRVAILDAVRATLHDPGTVPAFAGSLSLRQSFGRQAGRQPGEEGEAGAPRSSQREGGQASDGFRPPPAGGGPFRAPRASARGASHGSKNLYAPDS